MPIQILMIDDEPRLCAAVKQGLEMSGDFAVEYATSGKEGLLLARHNPPDLILLDIRMPKMDGIDVLRALKGKYPQSEIPVIVLSALMDEQTKRICDYEYGEDYIEKPVEIEELKARIETTLIRNGKRRPPPA